MNKRIKKYVIYFLPSIAAALVFLLGVYFGRLSITKSTEISIQKFNKNNTLGGIVSADNISGIAEAYENPEKARANINNYSWAVPNVFTPFVGSAPEPGTHQNASINSQQFRESEEIEEIKPENNYRIFLIGGSTAFGSGAPDQESTIAGYLSGLLNKDPIKEPDITYEVLTFANPAWASTHERIAIENRILEMDPDLVISLSGINDVHWAYRGKDIMWFRTYAEDFYWQIINDTFRLVGFPQMQDVTHSYSDPITPSLVAEKLIRNVDLSAYALSRTNTPYTYFLQPVIFLTEKPLTQREQKLVEDARLMAYFKESFTKIDSQLKSLHQAKFSYYNLIHIFDDKGAEDYFIDSYHFGDKGNKIIAAAIYEAIVPLLP